MISKRLSLIGCIAGALIALLLPHSAVLAADVFVSPAGNNTTGDGSEGNPYLTIQEGYLQSLPGDRIVVLPGTYTECVFASNFQTQLPPGQDKPITLIAKDWIDNNDNTTTIINGGPICGPGALSRSASVTIGSTDSRLEGFTIRGGGEAGVNAFGSVVITNNIIEQNSSEFGGGIFFYTANCYFGDSNSTIESNIVRNNEAFFNNTDGVGGDGGGIYVDGRALVDDPFNTCNFIGNSVLAIDNNTVASNTLNSSVRSAFGGGIFVTTNTGVNNLGDIGTIDVSITNNTITGNTMSLATTGYGGGVFVTTYGFGTEVITVEDNQIANNTARGGTGPNSAPGDGGGIGGWIQTIDSQEGVIDHQVVIRDNLITGNTAEGNGGGVDLFVIADDLQAATNKISMIAEDNTITGNSSAGNAGGGGGVLATAFSRRTSLAQGNYRFDVNNNRITDNDATFSGGGLTVLVTADGDPPADPGNTRQADASVTATNNLIANNFVSSANGSGHSIYSYLQAYGPGDGDAFLDLNTLAANTGPTAGVGGIHIEGRTDFDGGGTDEGECVINITNSIISENSGSGIGGAEPGVEDGLIAPANAVGNPNTGNVTVNVFTTDVFGHSGEYEGWVGDRTNDPVAGNLSVDPQLSTDNLFIPSACSPTIDAADSGVDFSMEPAPNGGVANMGHTGGTATATNGLVDLNNDNRVDGQEVLVIAAAFGGAQGTDPWYSPAADLDSDGDVDGDDLAIVAGDFATVCP